MEGYKTIEAINVREHEGEFLHQPALDFIAWVNAELAKIPQEFIHSAEIIISSETDYDMTKATFCIQYTRPETEEEKVQSQADARMRLLADIERTRYALNKMVSRYDQT